MVEYRVGRLHSPLVAIGITMMALAWLFAAAPVEAQNRTTVVRGGVAPKVQKGVPRKVRRTTTMPAAAANPAVTGRDAMLVIDAESGQELEAVSSPASCSATTTAASLADLVISPMIASRTASVVPACTPSFDGETEAARSDTGMRSPSRSLPLSSASKAR